MANNAHISIYGTVLADPSNKQVNGTTVVNMRVAVSTTKKNTDPNTSKQYPTASDVYDVVVWGKQGEALIGRVKAKTKVLVHGDFVLAEPWKDQRGNEHQSLRVTANSVIICSGGAYNGNNSAAVEEPAPF